MTFLLSNQTARLSRSSITLSETSSLLVPLLDTPRELSTSTILATSTPTDLSFSLKLTT